MDMIASAAPKPFAFVLMPFANEFDDVYRLGIQEACRKAGAYCERVDQQIFRERVLDRIYNQIDKADIVIADMSGQNANVFYEVGYAHALGKLTILLTRSADDIPYDLKHFPHIIYEGSLSLLQDKLEQKVAYFVSHPTKPVASHFPIDLLYEGQSVTSEQCVITTGPNRLWSVVLSVANTSRATLRFDDYSLALICDTEPYYLVGGRADLTSPARDLSGKYIYQLGAGEKLFPGEVGSIAFNISPVSPGEFGWDGSMVIRAFTEVGSRDFRIKLYRPAGNKK